MMTSRGVPIDSCGYANTGTEAVDTQHVLREEYCWLRPDEEQPLDENGFFERVREMPLAALCLSGGGIRSAAFALGVMQALSTKGILTGFHYLSTVSGGGYIGSFVQRWIKEHPQGAAGVMEALASRTEPAEIKHLRENSNFITPRVGLGSNDTWTAIAISLRNIIVNWLLFLPLFLLVALLPNWFLSGVDSVPTALRTAPDFDYWLRVVAAVAIAVSVAFTVPMLPSYRSRYGVSSARGDGWLFLRVVCPIMLWSVAGTLALSADLLRPVTPGAVESPLAPEGWRNGVPLARATLYGMLAGFAVGWLFIQKGHKRLVLGDIIIWPFSFIAAGLWVWVGAQMFINYAPRAHEFNWAAALLTVLGPLWLMSATLIGAVVFAAFRWAGEGQLKPDDDREWIARISGIKFKPMLAWALAGFSALLLSTLLRRWLGEDLSISALVALASGGATVAGGKSKESGGMMSGAASYVMRVIPLQGLIAIGTLLFVVALFVLLGGIEVRMAAQVEKPINDFLETRPDLGWIDATVIAQLVMALVLLLIVLTIGRLVQVNRFSLNGLYRNRLARAFLGAARPSRDPNPFTGFDSRDNIRLHQVRKDDAEQPGEQRTLYPIVNCALNVTATQNLAWQERKAQPFIFSPLFSGSGTLDREGTTPGSRLGAFVSSKIYGGSERDLALGSSSSGVTLATAVSVSGAAASPNMGYHSSPATAFLMTLFNVRLGAWLPNPALAATLGEKVGGSGPSDSLRAILRELAGSTDDRGKDIYLSDGGHFENLAVYEMLRRRCRYILVTDAGADPACAFADLGGLVRKAKIDFDTDINFGRMLIASRTADPKPQPQLAWAMGGINYPDGSEGTILYLKPSYFGDDLPVDIVSYANDSATFPHESTGDQFFSESQFESYRHLGFHFASQLAPGMTAATVDAFFTAADTHYKALNPQPLPPVRAGNAPAGPGGAGGGVA